MIIDPDEVRRLALTIAAAAAEVRAGADRSARVAEVRWVSTAAERFQRILATDIRVTRGAAQELDELHQALLDHASAVEMRLAEIAAAKQWAAEAAAAAREWAEEQGETVRDTADAVREWSQEQHENIHDITRRGWAL